jgi:hypothetical protein
MEYLSSMLCNNQLRQRVRERLGTGCKSASDQGNLSQVSMPHVSNSSQVLTCGSNDVFVSVHSKSQNHRTSSCIEYIFLPQGAYYTIFGLATFSIQCPFFSRFLTTALRGCSRLGEEAHLTRKLTNEGWILVDQMKRS